MVFGSSYCRRARIRTYSMPSSFDHRNCMMSRASYSSLLLEIQELSALTWTILLRADRAQSSHLSPCKCSRNLSWSKILIQPGSNPVITIVKLVDFTVVKLYCGQTHRFPRGHTHVVKLTYITLVKRICDTLIKVKSQLRAWSPRCPAAAGEAESQEPGECRVRAAPAKLPLK